MALLLLNSLIARSNYEIHPEANQKRRGADTCAQRLHEQRRVWSGGKGFGTAAGAKTWPRDSRFERAFIRHGQEFGAIPSITFHRKVNNSLLGGLFLGRVAVHGQTH